jgi:hypothetical protein
LGIYDFLCLTHPIGPIFFTKLNFFPPKLILVLWKRENLSEQKKFGGKKTWQKSFST